LGASRINRNARLAADVGVPTYSPSGIKAMLISPSGRKRRTQAPLAQTDSVSISNIRKGFLLEVRAYFAAAIDGLAYLRLPLAALVPFCKNTL